MPASAGGVKALAMATSFSNFTYEADVSVGPVGNAGLIFRASKPDIGADAYCGYYAGLNPQASQLEFGYASNGWHSLSTVPMSIGTNVTYHMKVDAEGNRLRIYVTNMIAPVVDITNANYASGMIGVRDYCTDGNQSLSSYANLAVREVTTLSPPMLTGLNAWYPFENNAQDFSGNGNNGVISGNVSFVPGKLGALAAEFDGTNGYVQIPRSISTNFTIAFWMNTTGTGGGNQWYNGKGLVDGEVGGVTGDFGTALVGNKIAFGVGNPDTTLSEPMRSTTVSGITSLPRATRAAGRCSFLWTVFFKVPRRVRQVQKPRRRICASAASRPAWQTVFFRAQLTTCKSSTTSPRRMKLPS